MNKKKFLILGMAVSFLLMVALIYVLVLKIKDKDGDIGGKLTDIISFTKPSLKNNQSEKNQILRFKSESEFVTNPGYTKPVPKRVACLPVGIAF